MAIAVPGAHVTVKSSALPTDPVWVTTIDFVTNWKIVDNTAVAKQKSADLAALKARFTGVRPSAPTYAAAIDGLTLAADELALIQAIEDELRLLGLRFHHVFFALETNPEIDKAIGSTATPAPTDPLAAVIWSRNTYLDPETVKFRETPAPALVEERNRLKRANDERSKIAKAIASTDVSEQKKLLKGLSCAATAADLAEKDKEIADRTAWIAYLEKYGTFYGYGGDGKFCGADDSMAQIGGAKLAQTKPLEDYLRKIVPSRVAELRQSVIDEGYTEALADEYVTMAIVTFARYLNREGLPNSVVSDDNTFTFGSGFNTYGGEGAALFGDLAEPTKRVRDRRNQIALGWARDFLLRCGIAVCPLLTERTPNVRILHFEGSIPYVLMTVEATPLPAAPKAPPAPRKPTATDLDQYREAQAKYKLDFAVWQAETKRIQKANDSFERFQSLEYLRRRRDLAKAFVLLGTKPKPPGAPSTVKDYQVVSALLEVSFMNYARASTAKNFPLWYMVRAGGTGGNLPSGVPSGTALFTFLHHIAWWGYGGFPNVMNAMRWSIARGYVGTRVYSTTHGSSGAAGDVSKTGLKDQKIELKQGAAPAGKSPTPYAQAPDDDDAKAADGTVLDYKEDDQSLLTGVVVEDSLMTPVGFARGLFTYVERTHQLALVSDIRFWGILCKLWTNFISDLKEERSLDLIPVHTIPLPTEVVYTDSKGKERKESVLWPAYQRDGKWYVAGAHKTEFELPPGVIIDDKGRVGTRTTKDGAGRIKTADELTSQDRLAKSLKGACPTFPYETLDSFRDRWADKLIAEAPISYDCTGFSPPNNVPRSGGKPRAVPLSDATYARLQRDIDAILGSYFTVALTDAKAGAARSSGNENTDRDSEGTVSYLSDMSAGVYVVTLKRDVEEIDVGRPASWGDLYKVKKLTVGSTAAPSAAPASPP